MPRRRQARHRLAGLGNDARARCRSGLPQEFFRVPSKAHIALWREGVRRARVFGRYPALLISLHADTIYAQYFNFNEASVENAEAVCAFLDEQHRFQARTAASLRADPK